LIREFRRRGRRRSIGAENHHLLSSVLKNWRKRIGRVEDAELEKAIDGLNEIIGG
jgi:hypothetical protein